jgi:hypothetical protein
MEELAKLRADWATAMARGDEVEMQKLSGRIWAKVASLKKSCATSSRMRAVAVAMDAVGARAKEIGSR